MAAKQYNLCINGRMGGWPLLEGNKPRRVTKWYPTTIGRSPQNNNKKKERTLLVSRGTQPGVGGERALGPAVAVLAVRGGGVGDARARSPAAPAPERRRRRAAAGAAARAAAESGP